MRWAANADPAVLARILKVVGIGIALVGVLLLIWRGPMGLLLTVAGVAVPLYLRWRMRQQRERAAAGPSRGRTSDLRTATLDMVLEHDSGRLDGTVRAGPYQGRRLSTLSLSQLLELLETCRGQDADSVPVLEAFLDRNFGADWRTQAGAAEGGGAGAAPRGGAMSREEAYEVLGLQPGASAEEIRQAHHRLMLKVHPDQGGSTYLAARLNEARDLLLGD
jgi:hypothetical protein